MTGLVESSLTSDRSGISDGGGTTVSRTFPGQNRLTAMGGATLAYDNNGGGYSLGYLQLDNTRNVGNELGVPYNIAVLYTVQDDANLDWTSDSVDSAIFSANYGSMDAGWATADFNYDGVCNVAELGLIATYLGRAFSPSYAPEVTQHANQASFNYDALGEALHKTDQNGTVHAYSFDILGRMTSDAVTTLASGVDSSVLRIDTSYDSQGNLYQITSYDAASGGGIVNQVQRAYNGLGQLTAEYQFHSGAVDTSTSPVVQYGYDTLASGSRMISMTYPNGTVLNYNYGTSGSLNDTISRLDNLTEGSQTLESYQYLGVGTVVERDHPEDGVNLTYIGTGTGDAGDQYTGLDRFGRVVDQKWTTSGGTVQDEYTYAYDRDSNVLLKRNALQPPTVPLLYGPYDEGYSYDVLNRLTAVARSGSGYQSFTLDALGNMNSVTTGGLTQDRTSNMQNQVITMGGESIKGSGFVSPTPNHQITRSPTYQIPAHRRPVSLF